MPAFYLYFCFHGKHPFLIIIDPITLLFNQVPNEVAGNAIKSTRSPAALSSHSIPGIINKPRRTRTRDKPQRVLGPLSWCRLIIILNWMVWVVGRRNVSDYTGDSPGINTTDIFLWSTTNGRMWNWHEITNLRRNGGGWNTGNDTMESLWMGCKLKYAFIWSGEIKDFARLWWWWRWNVTQGRKQVTGQPAAAGCETDWDIITGNGQTRAWLPHNEMSSWREEKSASSSTSNMHRSHDTIRLSLCNMIKFNRIWKENIHFCLWYSSISTFSSASS